MKQSALLILIVLLLLGMVGPISAETGGQETPAADSPYAGAFEGGSVPATQQYGGAGLVWRSGGGAVSMFAARSAIEELTVAYLECEPAIMILHEPAVWTVKTQGGSGDYEYKFVLYFDDNADGRYTGVKETGFSGSNTFTFTPDKAGYCFLEAYIRDSQGQQLVWRSLLVQAAPAGDGSSAQTVSGKVAALKAECLSAASTPYARAKWMHDWLVNHAQYDLTYTEYKADGVLLKGTGVCDSYASAYYLLMRALGIPCLKVANHEHAWNLVQLGGYWYHVDVTWDDPTPDGHLLYTHFLRSDDFIRQQRSHATWLEGNGIAPACPYDWGQAPVATPAPPSDDLSLLLTLVPAGSVPAGGSLQASWSISGGKEPYAVKEAGWVLYQDGADAGTSPALIEGNTSTFSPRFGTSGRFFLLINDATGATKYETADFTITGSPSPLSASVTLADSVAVNSPITASWEISGGVAPYTVDYCGFSLLGVRIRYVDGEAAGEYNYRLWEGEVQPQGNTATLQPAYGNRGQFILKLSDQTGKILAFEETFEITGTPEYKEMSLTLSLDPAASVAVGSPITATWTVSGGIAPYTLANCYWTIFLGDESIDWPKGEVIGNTSTLKPLEGDRGNFYLAMTDAIGQTQVQQADFAITGGPGPVALTISLNSDSADIGKDEHITATLHASGGSPPYTYAYTWYVTRDGTEREVKSLQDAGENTDSFMPAFGSAGRLEALVQDDRGRQAHAEAPFTLTGSLRPLTLSIAFDKEKVDADKGERITAALTADGGRPPYAYSFFWHQLDGGRESNSRNQWEVSSSTDTYAPTNSADSGTMSASVEDSLGNVAWAEKTFQVGPGDAVPALPGDADLSGVIDLQDLVALIDYLVAGKAPASMENANADGQGGIDIQDLVWVIDQIVGV
ncbi:MAG: transglutaminase domain-containing protein [Christensenellales bacterium]